MLDKDMKHLLTLILLLISLVATNAAPEVKVAREAARDRQPD